MPGGGVMTTLATPARRLAALAGRQASSQANATLLSSCVRARCFMRTCRALRVARATACRSRYFISEITRHAGSERVYRCDPRLSRFYAGKSADHAREFGLSVNIDLF